MDHRDAHERCLVLFGELVDGIPDEAWDDETPCEDWDVRALVNHNVAENRWAAELLNGRTIDEVGDRYGGDLLGDDPSRAYREAAEAARRAAALDGALEGDVHVSWGRIPAVEFLAQRWTDLLIHGWDLAVATEQPPRLPEDLVEAAYRGMAANEEAVRASGVFGVAVQVPDDAERATELLAIAGRDRHAWE
jgi:uncharacterized protein (TIGR03086 family)